MRDPTNLTCKEVVELVTEFLSNALSPEDQVRLEQHLLVCPPCTIHFGQVKTTVDLTARLRDVPPGEASPALIEAFRHRKQK